MKLRTPGTLSSAINEIKTKLSEGKCAELVERSESLIRKWALQSRCKAPFVWATKTAFL